MKLRTILRIATSTSVILLCAVIAISLYFRMSSTERAEDFDLYNLIPADSHVIVDTDNMVSLMQHINELSCSKDNHFLYFSKFFVYLKDHINTLLEDTPHGLSKQMNKMLISFHEPENDYNQVFYCRLGAGDYEFMEKFIQKYVAASFPTRYVDYQGEEVRIYPMPDDHFLACYINPEFLALSYQKRLIERVVDAYLSRKSILADEDFARLRRNHRMASPATIYTRMGAIKMGKTTDPLRFRTDLGAWTEFSVNLNGDAIYLSGTNYDTDSCATFMSVLRGQEPVNDLPGSELPASTFFFSRASLSDPDRFLTFTSRHAYVKDTISDVIREGDEVVHSFLKDYTGGMITTCMFPSADTLSKEPYAVISIPLQGRREVDNALANLYLTVAYPRLGTRPVSSTFFAGDFYTCYPLPHNTLFAQLTGMTDATLWACVYGNRLLVSPHAEGIQAYANAVLSSSEVLEDTSRYELAASDFSQPYQFLMMADMEHVLEQPESYVRFVPNLFFRYGDFFRHFILTAQFIYVDNVVYPNLILTYK